MEQRVEAYFAALSRLPLATDVSDRDGHIVPLGRFFATFIEEARAAHERGSKIMFIGNGGSAAIASHMATDFVKNGGLRAIAFNDGAALTCLGNDYGYPSVFAKQIEMHGLAGDVLVAISSSGESANILKAVDAARAGGCTVVTLSGFKQDNTLRGLGDFNLYVPAGDYGLVEVAGEFNRSSQHIQFDWPASTGPELRREFSIRGSCGAVY